MTQADAALTEALESGRSALRSAEANNDGSAATAARITALKALIATGESVQKAPRSLGSDATSTAMRNAIDSMTDATSDLSKAIAALAGL
jgi:hypothetical protein